MTTPELLQDHFTHQGATVSRFREVAASALSPGDVVYYRIRRPQMGADVHGPFTLVSADDIDVKFLNTNGIELVLTAVRLTLLRREEDDAVALVRAAVQKQIDGVAARRTRLAADMADQATRLQGGLGYVIDALRSGERNPTEVNGLGHFRGSAPLFDTCCTLLRELDKEIDALERLLELSPKSARIGE